MTATAVSSPVAAAARCLALDQKAATVVADLAAAGVPSVLIKGAGLARRVYGAEVNRRRYSDIDILVAPVDFARAESALTDCGYQNALAGLREDETHWYERKWTVPDHALSVDLHRGFAGVADPGAFWAAVAGAAEPMWLAGGMVRVPDAAGCALILALHAAAPCRSDKALVDLRTAQAALPADLWVAAADLAQAVDAESAYVEGLRRTPEGAATVARLGLVSHATSDQILRAQQAAPAVRQLAILVGVPGVAGKLRHLGHRLLPSPACMRLMSPLADHGAAGLVRAYVRRLVWLAGRTPGAVVQLQRFERTGTTERRSSSRRVRRLVRAVRRLTWRDALTCRWAWLALRQVRRQLPDQPLEDLRIDGAPGGGRDEFSVLRRFLRHVPASCLERSLIQQRWHASQGVACDLVVGVTAPGTGFRAHAWLAGDVAGAEPGDGTEILRRPTPTSWLADRG